MTPGGAANIEHSHFVSNSGSGFFIQGTGNLTYADITNEGLANALDPGLGVIIIPDWKPYAESGAAPGTGVVRGTSCFDSYNFAVSNGFAQLARGPSGVLWSSYVASSPVDSFTGSNATVALTFTLPAAPNVGDICDFMCSTVGPVVIQASGIDVIQIGAASSSAGGTATSTALGDSIHLVYVVANLWAAIGSPQGTWTLA